MQKGQLGNIWKHFQAEAESFDELIMKLIPYYNQMLEALVRAIPFSTDKKICVLDVGCGTGTIAQQVKTAFPNAQVHCIDIADKMLQVAQAKLSKVEDVTYEVVDFTHYNFNKTYDVIVSSLALHHLQSDKEQMDFWTLAYEALAPGGCMYNADVIWGGSEHIQGLNIEQWKKFMLKSVSEEEIENTWLPRYYAEDRPVPLMKQLSWMKDIGFKHVDVIWKYYGGAVYGGLKES